MADIIQLLPDHVANQIAAGEVVQRPASVVKELMENAIDAGSGNIQLIIKDSGKTLIQVIDDGHGMSDIDARLCIERHATSKIRTAEDLFAIHTKGFRGEALASIAAISHLELKTRHATDTTGTVIKVEGSKVISQEVDACQQGTSVAVKNLFFNIPARRNFLKSDAVELRHIIDEFHRVAMAHADVQFKCFHNDSELFNLPETNIRQRIVNIFGTKTNEKLVPVEEETELVKIGGFVVKPQFAKKTRGEQFFFVNNRFIKSPYLNHAVSASFEGLLREGTHASYFLFLEVDPKSIDINIHPTKTEIKFEDEHTIYAILRAAIKHSLGQFNISPILDFDRNASMDTPYELHSKGAAVPKIDIDRSFNPFEESNKQTGRITTKQADWESLYVGLGTSNEDQLDQMEHVFVESDNLTSDMFADQDNIPRFQTFQIHNKYIVSAIKSGLVIIDQHRAHLRILYESFLESITVEDGISQQLLFPLKLEFSTVETEIIGSIKNQLERAGFVFDQQDSKEINLTGIPANIEETEVNAVLEGLIHDVQNEVPESNFSHSDLVSKSLAKSLAIRSGKRLDPEEQENLTNRLFACKEPAYSPFNQKTFVTLTDGELDKKFN